MTRQEFTDAVAQLLGLHPGVEMQVDTITRLCDARAETVRMETETLMRREIAGGRDLQLPRLRRGPD